MGKLEELYAPILVEDGDDVGSNPSSNTPLMEIAQARLGRRAVLRGFASAAAVAGMGGTLTSKIALAAGEGLPSTLGFQSLPQTITEKHAVAPGYTAEVLIRWGDPILPGAPEFDPANQTGEAQAKQFGYNCDFLGYFPLPRGSDSSEHGLLHSNHEYTSQELMFPGWTKLEAGPPAQEKAAAEARQKALAEGKGTEEAEKAAKAAGETARVEAIAQASLDAQTPEQTRVEMMALTEQNGFKSQADVLIETRRAADLVGATPMDRPEDVQPNPANGRVYVLLTNNTRRKQEQVDAVNPRANNAHGQVVELVPPGGEGADADHAADEFGWNIFLMGGDPTKTEVGAKYHDQTQAWLSSPDNCAFDAQGRLWISTDQGGAQAKNAIPDGMFACDISGDGRALLKFFFACPVGAEMCGPEFTPDGKTLFVAVQHPAEADGYASTYENPTTRWPDFKDAMPPRPSIVAITKDNGELIGS